MLAGQVGGAAQSAPPPPKTATEIMQAVQRALSRDRRSGKLVMTVRDRSGATTTRTLVLRTMASEGIRRSIIFVAEPVDARGTGYLTIDRTEADGTSERMLYLPQLKRVVRVAGNDVSGAFMGSDFSYADLSDPRLSEFDFQLLRETDHTAGEDCWIVRVTPKKAPHPSGYRVSDIWVSKSKLIILRIRGRLSGGRTKYIRSSNLERHDNKWIPRKMVARTLDGQELLSETTLFVESLTDPDSSISAGDFTRARLERGL